MHLNRVCNLECVKTKKPPPQPQQPPLLSGVREFVGPVKISFVDKPVEKWWKEWLAAFIVMATLFIGGTNVTIIMHSFSFLVLPYYENLHVLFCTLSLQLFVPLAILSLNTSFGGAVHLTELRRKIEHTYMQILAIIGSLYGTYISFTKFKIKNSAYTNHAYLGILANVCALINILTGAISLYGKKTSRIMKIPKAMHVIFGTISFISSSSCFITGIIKPEFAIWFLLMDIPKLLVVFCIVYTIIVVFTPLKKLITLDV